MIAPFTKKLLHWNKTRNERQMPWKGEKDPYKIWLSEIILQQTRVAQGWAYYEKFIQTFPSIHQLAKASDKKVFKLWEGLGYYNRCKNLIATARYISKELKGKFPTSYIELLNLKGIGPYTAAAIASFAFNEKQAVVDGNVQRILSRYFGITTPVDSMVGKKLFQQLASALVHSQKPGIYNQAIMDFGATVCKPANPLCHQCCQQMECEAFRHNKVKELPVKEKSISRKERWFHYYIIEVSGAVYVRKRSKGDIWENLYEFVLLESDAPLNHAPEESTFIKNLLRKQAYKVIESSKVYRQILTHQQINGRFIRISSSRKISALREYELVQKDKLNRYAFPSLINNYLG